MKNGRWSGWLIAGLATPALVSCSDSTAPRVRFSEVAGTYDLVMVGQDPLPYSRTYHPGGTISISGGSLVLGTDGQFTQSQHQNGSNNSWQGTYSVTDSAVVLHIAGNADSTVLHRDNPALVSTWQTFVMHGRVSNDYSYAMYGLALYDTHQMPYCTSYNVCIADARLYLWASGKFTAVTAPFDYGSLPADIVTLPGSGTYTINSDTVTLSSGSTKVIGLKAGSGIRFNSLTYIPAFDPATAASDTLRLMAPAEGSRYTYAGTGGVVVGVKALVAGADGAVMDVNGGLDQSMAASCSTAGGGCTDTYSGIVTLAKGLIQGLNTIVVKAYKGPTLVSSGTVHVTLWETPQLKISAPDTNATFATDSDSFEITGTATHSQRVARLTWQVNGGTEHDVAIAPGTTVSFDFRASLDQGPDRVVLRAYNDSGQTTPFPVRAIRSLPPTSPGAWKDISSATGVTCGITTSDATYCWGVYSGPVPHRVAVPTLASMVAVGQYAVEGCGLDAAGAVYCWGGAGTATATATLLPGNLSFTKLAAGTYGNICGVTTDGAIYCWAGSGAPVRQAPSQKWKDVAVGWGRCALDTTGKAFCWGGYPYPDTLVTAFPDLSFQSLSMYSWATCGVATDSNTYCWGSSANYGLVGGGYSFRSTTAGTCGFTTAANAYCNLSGGKVPTQVGAGLEWTSFSANGALCGATTNGAAYCWGSGTSGQLGNGSTWTVSTPVRVIDPP